VDQKGFVAKFFNGLQGVRHKHKRLATPLKIANTIEATQLKLNVTHREHLVDQQHIGIDLGGDRESQAHVHPARIIAHGHVDKIVQSGKIDDGVKSASNILARNAQQRGVEIDVFPPGQIAMKPCAQLKQGANAALGANGSARWGDGACGKAKGRAFPGTIGADDADGASFFDGK
jgi:hypothetical protein